ncbi:MAG: hypothetical protein KGJ78_16630 [Alphaproteobacteria bacterium]|nr:hypothetical protein [Alphaproteobacteria bacterium]
MYALVTEDLEQFGGTVGSLEQAFAQVCCRAGFTYYFEQEQDGWRLVLTDGERPECSPEPIQSTYIKRADAHRDLMQQAIDGRLNGIAAMLIADLRLRREQLLHAAPWCGAPAVPHAL